MRTRARRYDGAGRRVRDGRRVDGAAGADRCAGLTVRAADVRFPAPEAMAGRMGVARALSIRRVFETASLDFQSCCCDKKSYLDDVGGNGKALGRRRWNVGCFMPDFLAGASIGTQFPRHGRMCVGMPPIRVVSSAFRSTSGMNGGRLPSRIGASSPASFAGPAARAEFVDDCASRQRATTTLRRICSRDARLLRHGGCSRS